jgi:hypothetical protein
MRLYLTSYNPAICSYCTRDGKAVYKVLCSSTGLGETTATIWRAFPKLDATTEEMLWVEKHFGHDPISHPSIPYSNEENVDHFRGSFEFQDDGIMSWAGPPPTIDDYRRHSSKTEAGVGLTHIAEIELHTIASTIIRHLGNEWRANEFLRKAGWSWYGRSGNLFDVLSTRLIYLFSSDRIFKGPDGKEYRWKMGPSVSEANNFYYVNL